MKRLAWCLVFAAATAHAQTRQECAQASEDAQLLKLKGQLVAARAKLLVCSNDACPKVVKADCNGWLDEVDRATPTIVLGARDAQGKDLTDVHVSIDGVSVVDRLDGRSLPVDPGRHVVRFDDGRDPPKEETVVVREAEKDRPVTTTLGAAIVVAPPPLPPPPTPSPLFLRPTSRAPSVATWVVGGLGLATLAAAGIIGTASLVQRSNLYNSCGMAGTCSQSDVDAVYLMYDLAYGGAALGGALVVTSIILFFTTRPSAVRVAPTPGGIALFARF